MSAPVEKYHRPVAARDDWETPPDLFARFDAEFHFTLDAAATDRTAKCTRYFTPDDDGLAQDWGRETVWLNPPYGRAIRAWVRKAWESAQAGATVVCLIPARTCSGWWHDYAERADERRFLRGRIRFVGAPYNAPFPSALVVFRPQTHAEPDRENPSMRNRDVTKPSRPVTPPTTGRITSDGTDDLTHDTNAAA